MTAREIVERMVEVNEERFGGSDDVQFQLLIDDFAVVIAQVPEARRIAAENLALAEKLASWEKA